MDALYGLEPVIGGDALSVDNGASTEFVRVACPYCGEEFETSVDASAGLCSYVEDCQVCCQPIEMELRVDENGAFQRARVATRRCVRLKGRYVTEKRVALITGAGSGIGKATALAFLRDGFRVVLAGRHADKLEAWRAKPGDGAARCASSPT